jgi:tRNA1Val (adenine37-N6)-methyltransferase
MINYGRQDGFIGKLEAPRMSNSYFSFKQFTVYHDQCAMKVGTDGVLLGSWAAIENASRVLDVGTGTGLIAIMLAQRSEAVVDGVEIDESACRQARRNAESNPWHGRINLFHDSFQHFSETTSYRYNVIVSNPPYFQDSLRPQTKSKTMAKHNVGLTYDTLLSCTSGLLLPEGRFSVIIPATDQKQFEGLADFYRLKPSRLTWIRPVPGKEYSRCLMEFSTGTDYTWKEDELVIRNGDGVKGYSMEYIELTKEFYQGF